MRALCAKIPGYRPRGLRQLTTLVRRLVLFLKGSLLEREDRLCNRPHSVDITALLDTCRVTLVTEHQ